MYSNLNSISKITHYGNTLELDTNGYLPTCNGDTKSILLTLCGLLFPIMVKPFNICFLFTFVKFKLD